MLVCEMESTTLKRSFTIDYFCVLFLGDSLNVDLDISFSKL
jgi:hypothetical protein